MKKSILTMLQRTHLRHLFTPIPGPWWQHLKGWLQGQQELRAPPVEEAGIDAVAGTQVLVDSVHQLDHPSKALQPWLQESTVHTDLLAWTPPPLPTTHGHAL